MVIALGSLFGRAFFNALSLRYLSARLLKCAIASLLERELIPAPPHRVTLIPSFVREDASCRPTVVLGRGTRRLGLTAEVVTPRSERMWPWTGRGRTTDRPKPPSLSRPGRKAGVYLCRRASAPAEEARKRRATRKRCRRSGAPDGCPIQHRNAAARCPAVLIIERICAPRCLSAMKLLADFVRRDAVACPSPS